MAINQPNNLEIPPWKSPEVWSQFCRAMEHTVGHQSAGLEEARILSWQIRDKFEEVNAAIDSVGKETCLFCKDICCKKATVWYDFKDMLYLYLHSGQFPEAQITKEGDLSCCNLTSTGCLLPRRIRPFICTWYICPSQTAMLSEKMVEEPKARILSSIQEIQRLRKRLEDTFIKAVLSG